ncbi:DUF4097 family beta strand repeat-containing protein [Pseudochryseolinea flava]|uniref:Adhesin domain-containing protein n=1 Tax=Pseudochryseolinea flava TaxID=2059302 RepID=A0A364Y6D9_9BACT|nr:hypothetical protein [Pseudochryseolinea flava]RAW01795.1 hypothetical protein DQQ10_09115 [Pseudochryseolinea flava]
MKKIMIVLLIFISQVCLAQTFQETITKELSFETKNSSNALVVANINGSIKVMGYAGDKIIVVMDKTITAKTEARIEKGKKVSLGIIDRSDSLILFVDGLCQRFDKASDRGHFKAGWGYQWNCENCSDEFDHQTNFTIKVPFDTHVSVATINKGNVVIENVKGVVSADNVNGSIRLENLEREAAASTINGDLDVTYATNPKNPCRFYSLNGDINALFRKGLAANLSFESFNGDFYTNIDRIQKLPAKLEQEQYKEGMKYKIGGDHYQVGAGGSLLDFETFNGNVYLKENTN